MNQFKWSEILKSKNFLVSLFSLVLLGFGANNISVDYNAEELYTLFTSTTGQELLITIIMFIINSGFKIYLTIKEKGFSFEFLKSTNFHQGILITLSILISAIFNELYAGIIISIVVIVLNILYNIFLVPHKEVVLALTTEPLTENELIDIKTENTTK